MIFELADETSLPTIVEMVAACINHMRVVGIDQWDEIYPTADIFRRDFVEGNLLILKDGELRVVGCATLDDQQAPEYVEVGWMFSTGPIGVVHRLMISPFYMCKGLSKILMNHVEKEAKRRGYCVLRLDAFLKNPAALRLYTRLGYRHAGEVQFRKGTFACFEKQIDDKV